MAIFGLMPRKRKQEGKAEPPTARVWRSVYRRRADNVMKGNEAIYAAVSRIANTVATMPLHLYRGNIIAYEHPLEKLFGIAPNPNFTPFGFISTMEVCRNLEGCAYALIKQDKLGRVEQLDILDPARVRPQRSSETGEMWYWVTLEDGEKPFAVPGCMIVTLRHLSANGELGIKPVDVLRGTIEYDAKVKEYSAQQLDGINQGVMLKVPGALGREARDRLVENFLEAYERSGHRVVILEGNLDAQNFGQTPVSAQVLDTERIMRNRVATVYNIPPHLLGDYSDTSFQTAEQQMMEFLNLTIMPIAAQWEQELNRKLLLPEEIAAGYRFAFDPSALLRADRGVMAEVYQKSVRGGWMTPNEVRAKEGLPPKDNGDELMASRDLITLSTAVQHPELLLGGKVTTEEGGKK